MLLSKSNLCKSLFVILLPLSLSAAFNDTDCLNSIFESSVSHKGAPLGLTNTIIKVKKDKCLITIEHEELKFRTNKWIIDVCREPIHIKSGSGTIEVFKKEGRCSGAQNNKEFCNAVNKIELVLQDDGLIFAEGEKENLTREHGQLYCTFLILKSYLRNDFIYSRDGKYENTMVKSILENKKDSCAIDTRTELKKSSTKQTEEIEVDTSVSPAKSTQDIIPNTNEEGRF